MPGYPWLNENTIDPDLLTKKLGVLQFLGDPYTDEQIAQAAAKAPAMAREILAEVKCNGVGDNKNILAELNIETTRHQECGNRP